jgi:hypothetical protein
MARRVETAATARQVSAAVAVDGGVAAAAVAGVGTTVSQFVVFSSVARGMVAASRDANDDGGSNSSTTTLWLLTSKPCMKPMQ